MKEKTSFLTLKGYRCVLNLFCIPVYLLCLTAPAISQNTHSDSAIAATVNGEPIAIGEYMLQSQNERAGIV